MKLKELLLTTFLAVSALTIQAQSFIVEGSLLVTNLTDTTNFSLLNARLGLGFTFHY